MIEYHIKVNRLRKLSGHAAGEDGLLFVANPDLPVRHKGGAVFRCGKARRPSSNVRVTVEGESEYHPKFSYRLT